MADPKTTEPSLPSSVNIDKLVGGPIAAALFDKRSDFLYPAKCTLRVTTWNVAAIDGTERETMSILWNGREGLKRRRRGTESSRSIISVDSSFDTKSLHRALDSDRPSSSKGSISSRSTSKQSIHQIVELHGKTHNDEDGDGDARIEVICLQEVMDVTTPQNFLKTTDEKIQKLWKDEIEAALPGYHCVVQQQLVGLLMFIYVSPDLASQTTTPCSTTVGTGLMGYMGNKGATLGRIVLGGLPAAGVSPPSLADSSCEAKEEDHERGLAIVFVNCHLAAFANATERRNWDYAEIPRRAYFHPKPLAISGGGSQPEAIAAAHPSGYPIRESDLVVWAGDLNYRIDMPGDDIRTVLHPFLPPESDGSDPPLKLSPVQNAETPDTVDGTQEQQSKPKVQRGFQDTISYLLESDQLRAQQQQGKAFQYYHEGQITFLPTYKYDPETISTFDTSEKMRAPSYCDRVLWKDWKVEEIEIERMEARKLADSRDKKRESHLKQNDSSDVLFDLGKDDEDDEAHNEQTPAPPVENEAAAPPKTDHEITTINGIDISDVASPLKLLKYGSYQSITASDHKPVVAEFSLEYTAVDQVMRSQIQIETVKELDRNENEARPAVTLIVEGDDNNEVVNFGEVTWDQVVKRTVTIANTGRSAAVCEFVKRPVMSKLPDDDDESDAGFTKVTSAEADDPMAFGDDERAENGEPQEELCREWVSATFETTGSDAAFTLQPGDAESITLKLSLPPSKYGPKPRSEYARLLRQLNTGKEDLADVLVLRVANGQDKFIPVKAVYKPTILGYSLTELLRVPESSGGIRNNRKVKDSAHWSAPRELFRITEFLMLTLKSIVLSEGGEGVRWTMLPGWPFVPDTWGLTNRDEGHADVEDELTRISIYARSALKRWIREGLDCDKDWQWDDIDKKGYSEEDKCEVMAECLLDWLDYLKEGVIPASLHSEVVKMPAGKATADKILDILPSAAPSVHSNVFIYLTGFIGEIISLLSPKQDGATSRSSFVPPISPSAIAKRLSGGSGARSRLTTTELVKRNILKEFADVLIRKPAKVSGWRSERQEKLEDERRIGFLASFLE